MIFSLKYLWSCHLYLSRQAWIVARISSCVLYHLIAANVWLLGTCAFNRVCFDESTSMPCVFCLITWIVWVGTCWSPSTGLRLFHDRLCAVGRQRDLLNQYCRLCPTETITCVSVPLRRATMESLNDVYSSFFRCGFPSCFPYVFSELTRNGRNFPCI